VLRLDADTSWTGRRIPGTWRSLLSTINLTNANFLHFPEQKILSRGGEIDASMFLKFVETSMFKATIDDFVTSLTDPPSLVLRPRHSVTVLS